MNGDVRLTSDTPVGRPAGYALQQNHPNPFNPHTTIDYYLPESGHVLLSIFNLAGQQVRTLVNAPVEAGFHVVEWDGRDEQG